MGVDMSAGLLAELARMGVRVERSGGRLLLDGPNDVLTDALVTEIDAAKPELLAALNAGAGDSIPGADHRRAADASTLRLRCVFHPDRPVVEGDRISCAECRVRLDALGHPERTAHPTAPAPWRCYACRGTRRSYRPTWGDWTCNRCSAIVARPEQTERTWQLAGRYGPCPVSTVPRVVWGQRRGYIAIHDSAADTWHEIAYRDAPAAWQAAVHRRRADPERE
jgi:hypothetical protein